MKTPKLLIVGLSLVILFLLPLASVSHAYVSTDISADEFVSMDKQEIILLDVRTVKEYHDGHIPGAINLPVDDLPDLFSQLTNKEQKIVVYCRSGFRAGKAIDFLKEQGYTNLVHLDGDFSAWAKQERPIANP